MIARLTIPLLLVCLCCLSGCCSMEPLTMPDVPAIMEGYRDCPWFSSQKKQDYPPGVSQHDLLPLHRYKPKSFIRDWDNYRTLVDAKPPDYTMPDENRLRAATALRNQMINRLQLEIDINYRDFEIRLYTRHSFWDTTADLTGFGLNAAGATVGGSALKSLLAIAAGGVSTTRSKVYEHWLDDATSKVLMHQMQLERARVKERIGLKRQEDVTVYPIEEALSDLVDLYNAGTLKHAVQTLTRQTQDKLSETEKKLEKQAQLKMLEARLQELRNSNEPGDKERVKRILKRLGVKLQYGEDVFDRLEEEIDAAYKDDAKREKLMVLL